MSNPHKIEVTLIKSLIGEQSKIQACVRGLGLRRIRQKVQITDNPSNRGMVNKARHLLDITEDIWDWKKLSEMERIQIQRHGQALSRIPMSHAVPILIANTELPADNSNISNGTGSLVQTSMKKLCITNWHVIDAFRQRKHQDDNTRMLVGQAAIDLEHRLIDEDQDLDLAVLDFDDIEPPDFRLTTDVQKSFVQFKRWPPVLPEEGSYLMFGGYPKFSRRNSDRTITYGFISAGAAMAYSVSTTNIVCHVKKDQEYMATAGFQEYTPIDLAGMSGGPVLAERTSDAGIVLIDIIGFIYEHNEAFDAMRIRPATFLKENGKLRRLDD